MSTLKKVKRVGSIVQAYSDFDVASSPHGTKWNAGINAAIQVLPRIALRFMRATRLVAADGFENQRRKIVKTKLSVVGGLLVAGLLAGCAMPTQPISLNFA